MATDAIPEQQRSRTRAHPACTACNTRCPKRRVQSPFCAWPPRRKYTLAIHSLHGALVPRPGLGRPAALTSLQRCAFRTAKFSRHVLVHVPHCAFASTTQCNHFVRCVYAASLFSRPFTSAGCLTQSSAQTRLTRSSWMGPPAAGNYAHGRGRRGTATLDARPSSYAKNRPLPTTPIARGWPSQNPAVSMIHLRIPSATLTHVPTSLRCPTQPPPALNHPAKPPWTESRWRRVRLRLHRSEP